LRWAFSGEEALLMKANAKGVDTKKVALAAL
jgi:hypothetical protein